MEKIFLIGMIPKKYSTKNQNKTEYNKHTL